MLVAVSEEKKCSGILSDYFKNKEYSLRERISTHLFGSQWSFISACVVTC